jgi:hypothetical protein
VGDGQREDKEKAIEGVAMTKVYYMDNGNTTMKSLTLYNEYTVIKNVSKESLTLFKF